MSEEKKNESKAEKKEEILKGIWDSLTDEQKKKVKACKSKEEIASVLGEASGALSDEALDDVAGGAYYQYNQNTNKWDVFLQDGYKIDTLGTELEASGIAEFYSYLEKLGEI